jgi:hypothetical protein
VPVTDQTLNNLVAGPYAANGVTQSFPFLFRAVTASELRVELLSSGGATAIINPVDYRVVLATEGGDVLFDVPPTGGSIYIYPEPSFEQEAVFEDGGPLRAKTLNALHDRAALRDIYLKDRLAEVGTLAAAIGDAAKSAAEAAEADADRSETAAGTARIDRQAILAAIAAHPSQGTLMIPVGTRGLLAALSDISVPVQFDGSVWEFDGRNHWNGRPDVSAFNANASVAPLGAAGFAVTKVAGGAAYNGAAVSDDAFTGDYELWARNATVGSYDAYVGVVADARAGAGADLAYAFSVGGSIVYVRRYGADIAQYSLPGAGAVSPNSWIGLVRRNGVTQLRVNNTGPSLGTALPAFHTFDNGAADNTSYEARCSILQVGARLDMLPLDIAGAGTGDAQADTLGRMLVRNEANAKGRLGGWARPQDGLVHVEWFMGEGVTDEQAWAAAFRWIEHKNGGTICTSTPLFEGWGEQSLTGIAGMDGSWVPKYPVEMKGVAGDVTIVSRCGTTIKARNGYRYGSFDPVTGQAIAPALPFYEADKRATPFEGMFHFEKCTGAIRIKGFKFDGNVQNAIVGGGWGDTGFQIPGSGIATIDCTGIIEIEAFAENCPFDSFLISNRFMASKSQDFAPVTLRNFGGEASGRQIVSLIGGRGITLENFSLSKAGKNGKVRSNPASNIDIEPEAGAYSDNITLRNGELVDADSNGLIMASGRTQHVKADMMLFVGTTGHAAWIEKASYRSEDSRYVGTVRCLWADNPDSPVEEGYAAEFLRDEFTDDPAFSPTGVVYNFGPCIAFANDAQVRFNRAKFNMTDTRPGFGELPDSNPNSLYDSCKFKCANTNSQTTGRFIGATEVIGSLGTQVRSRMIEGSYTVNGVPQFRGTLQADLPSLAPGASTQVEVAVPSAQADDERTYSLKRAGGWGGLVAFPGEVITDGAAGPGTSGTVRFTIMNPPDAAGPVDLPSATLTAIGTR